jgi:hypothetical protein
LFRTAAAEAAGTAATLQALTGARAQVRSAERRKQTLSGSPRDCGLRRFAEDSAVPSGGGAHTKHPVGNSAHPEQTKNEHWGFE